MVLCTLFVPTSFQLGQKYDSIEIACRKWMLCWINIFFSLATFHLHKHLIIRRKFALHFCDKVWLVGEVRIFWKFSLVICHFDVWLLRISRNRRPAICGFWKRGPQHELAGWAALDPQQADGGTWHLMRKTMVYHVNRHLQQWSTSCNRPMEVWYGRDSWYLTSLQKTKRSSKKELIDYFYDHKVIWVSWTTRLRTCDNFDIERKR